MLSVPASIAAPSGGAPTRGATYAPALRLLACHSLDEVDADLIASRIPLLVEKEAGRPMAVQRRRGS